MKKCTACKEQKPFSEFHKNRAKSDGFGTECIPCAQRYAAAYRATHKEELAAGRKRWAATRPGYDAEKSRAFKQNNPEYQKEWHGANPDARRSYENVRRSRKMDSFVEFVDADILYERDNGVCGICGEIVDRSLRHPDPGSNTMDHVKPLAKGGEHSYANCQTAHLRCNVRKGSK